jgi:hypothetical protein
LRGLWPLVAERRVKILKAEPLAIPVNLSIITVRYQEVSLRRWRRICQDNNGRVNIGSGSRTRVGASAKKVAAGCPNGVPSRVVSVLALRADGKTTKPQEKKDAEISIYPTE